MNVDLGVYSKKRKDLPKVIGPRRRFDKKSYTRSTIQTQPEHKSRSIKKIGLWIGIILVFCAIGAAVWRFNAYKSRVTSSVNGSATQVCDNIFNPKCWDDAFKPTFKQTDGYTNALLLGIDKRPAGHGSDLKNTDTIIVASINHEKKKAMLISIPRDMLINVKINGKTCCAQKINAVYSLADARSDSDDGLELLTSNIEELLGIEIHYQAMVDFEAVKGAVDAVGGVELDIKDEIKANYPDELPPYAFKYYTIKKGVQTLDGKHALIYARFRHGSPAKYASDFSRAERQQEVIDALKTKVLADEEEDLSKKARKYWDIYQSLSDHVEVRNVGFEEALAGFSLIGEYDQNPINIVLDPSFGGLNRFISTGDSSAGFGYHIKANNFDWAPIRKEIARIWENPGVYDDNAKVVLSNRYSTGFASDSPAYKLDKSNIPFGSLKLITESKTDRTGIIIYDFSGGKMIRTIEFLKQYFGGDSVQVVNNPAEKGVTQSKNKEDIKVEFGPSEATPTPSPTSD